MNAVILIAGDSIRALLHRRLLVALMLVMLGITVVFSQLLGQMQDRLLRSAEQAAEAADGGLNAEQAEQIREGMDVAGSAFMAGFYGLTAFGCTLVALFICSMAVSSDIRQGTIYAVLSKPVSRAQFLLGKYCGALVVLGGYAAIAGIAMAIFAHTNELDLNVAARYAPWLMFCQSLMLGSLALLLSLWIHPVIAAVIAYFASASFLASPNPLYFILPSPDRFNVAMLIMQGRLIASEDVMMLTLYAFDVAAILILLALWRFRSRDLL